LLQIACDKHLARLWFNRICEAIDKLHDTCDHHTTVADCESITNELIMNFQICTDIVRTVWNSVSCSQKVTHKRCSNYENADEPVTDPEDFFWIEYFHVMIIGIKIRLKGLDLNH
jgi:hypothetical protein